MAILILHPKLGFSEDNANHETPVKLGDGYLMAGRVKGSDRKTYSISGILRTEAELTEIIGTFESLAGAVPFEWSPIPAFITRKSFYCASWDVSPIGADSQGKKWEFSAKFEEAR